MGIDVLQEKIRKQKMPALLELALTREQIPGSFLEDRTTARAMGEYARALLQGLKGKLPGVRFSFTAFAVFGAEGIGELCASMKAAKQLGYYILLDAPELLSPSMAQAAAEGFFGEDSVYPCDGLVVTGYLGSDIWKPFVPYCKKNKDIFVVARTGNKSASEIQDLISGVRVVHAVAADYANRYTADTLGRCGYSSVGVMAAASSTDALRSLRGKYPRVFVLVDGYDYPGGNAKNCASAFDKLGHGAVVCAGSSIAAAWQGMEESCWLEQAAAAVERMKKNLGRYVTVL